MTLESLGVEPGEESLLELPGDHSVWSWSHWTLWREFTGQLISLWNVAHFLSSPRLPGPSLVPTPPWEPFPLLRLL